MNMRWNLDSLYTSFESQEFKNDLDKLYEKVDEFKNWTNENLNSNDNVKDKMERYLNMQISLYSLFINLSAFAGLTSSVEAKNVTALKTTNMLQVKFSELTEPMVVFEKWLNSLDNLNDIINSSDFLKEHEFFLKETAQKAKYLLSEKEEILISKLSNTGSKAWLNLQNVVSSTLLVDITIDGEEKELPLPVVKNMAYKKSPEVRKTAYEAELKAYEKIDESSAAALNGIKGEILTVSEMRGYKSPLEKTLIQSRMDKATLDAMHIAIKESLPVFHKYFKRKAELLGHENGLPFHDLFAPMGEIDIKFTYEEARDYIVKNFRSFSDKLANFADNAFENNWIDAEPREGKRGGAFCAGIPLKNESRILLNFDGSFMNMITLAHELGHAYHGLCLSNESLLNRRTPLPVAETASIFAQSLVVKATLENASEEEAFSILEASVQSTAHVIVDIYSRFLFESKLFETRKDHTLSVNELKNIMTEAQKEAYGDGLDHNYLHPYMWACKPHYYLADLNFYNFPYAFGELFANGVYAEYIKQGDTFVKDYDKLLAATGKNSIVDVCSMMNIDVNSMDFWRSSLKVIEEDINKFIELSQSLK